MSHTDTNAPAADGRPPREDGYWSDDRDLQLRQLAPEPCRGCQNLITKESFIMNGVFTTCGAVDQTAANGAILATIMVRLAESGPCLHRIAI